MENVDNVVLISVDSLRYDCVSYQKNKNVDNGLLKKHLKTPVLDGLEKNSICFTNVYSNAVYTTTAHASLFTGKLPPQHGIREFYYTGERMDLNIATLAENYKKQGYVTTVNSDVSELLKSMGILRGFDNVFSQDLDFFDYLKRNKSKKNFIFLHFFDVHYPYLYSPSEFFVSNEDYYREVSRLLTKEKIFYNKMFWNRHPEKIWKNIDLKVKDRKKKLLPLYLKGISKFDRGRFKLYQNLIIKYLKSDNTISFIFSDHGEGVSDFHDKKYFGHYYHLSDDTLRIPLLIHSKKFKKIVCDNLLSLNEVYYILFDIPVKGFDLKSVLNFKGEPSKYAENWQQYSQSRKPSYKTRKQRDYFLNERVLISRKYKLMIRFKPEKFLRLKEQVLLKRFEVKKILLNIFQMEVWPKKYIRYMFYLMGLVPYWGSKFILAYAYSLRKEPMFVFYKYDNNKRNAKKITSFESKYLLPISAMAFRIFRICKVGISKKRVISNINNIRRVY